MVTKLCDADFARRARIADFLGRAWESLRDAGAGDGDKVSKFSFENPTASVEPFPGLGRCFSAI